MGSAEGAEEQALFQTLRSALRAKEPLDFLSAVGGLLAATDPRGAAPFAPDEPRVGLDDLVESFVGTSYAETTAALTVIQAMVADDLMATRIGRELSNRRQPMPDWLSGLGQARAEDEAWFMTHVLRDGDNYLFGATLPSGHSLSAIVYIDHNLGTVVKDAFVVPEPVADLAETMVNSVTDPDQTMTRADAATARAVVERAIDHGARMYPPLESDTWPMCRPLVEWLARLLPSGGVVPERPEWSEQALAELAESFFDSTFGAAFDHADGRGLLESVSWFATDYGPGDPLRWSPVSVEVLLTDWFPRKIVAEPEFLAQLPELLRAFIRYAHDQRGIRSALTADTLVAVDRWEPEYQQLIRSDRPQGPAALLAQLLSESEGGLDLRGLDLSDTDLDDEDFDDDYPDDVSVEKIMLERLDRLVGGRVQLQNLDAVPLPDEPFEWADIAEDIRPVVEEVLAACDKCADELLDVEHRTAMRRFLSRAAAGDPAAFRRKASPVRGAAAVAWVICRANETAGVYWTGLSVQELLAHFGVKGSVSQRAEPFLRANGVDPRGMYGTMELGTPDLLTSERRATIIEHRDWYAERETR